MSISDSSFTRPLLIVGFFTMLALWLAQKYGDHFWRWITAVIDLFS